MVKEVLAAAAIVVGMVLTGKGGIMEIGAEAFEGSLEEEQILEGVLEGHLMDLAGHPLHHPL